jgi:hypothetical protein
MLKHSLALSSGRSWHRVGRETAHIVECLRKHVGTERKCRLQGQGTVILINCFVEPRNKMSSTPKIVIQCIVLTCVTNVM